jgi:quinol monooxygenase YgiN
MVTHGLLVRLETMPGRDDDMEAFLLSALPLVRNEPDTSAWFAVRFGRSEYGIFDAFPGEEGRRAHLAGAVAAALGNQGKALLAREPRMEPLAVLASKLPTPAAVLAGITRGLLLTFKARQGHEAQVENFLRGARAIVDEEPGTIAWFAIRLDSGEYGIFDVFPDNSARLAHLTGHVPRELTKHALSLLGGVPDMDMLQVLAAHFAERVAVTGMAVD